MSQKERWLCSNSVCDLVILHGCHALLVDLIGWLLPMQSQSCLELSTELWRKLAKAHDAATLLSVSYNS